jgi:hypothetical protein
MRMVFFVVTSINISVPYNNYKDTPVFYVKRLNWMQ